MQSKRYPSKKRYQTTLPSSVEAVTAQLPDVSPAKAKLATKIQAQDTQPRIVHNEPALSIVNYRPNHDQNSLPNGNDKKHAVRLVDSQLPYQRLLQERDYARNIAAQLELSNEGSSSVRGQNSSETDRCKTESSKSSNPSQHTGDVSRNDKPLDHLTKSPVPITSTGGSLAVWNHMELLERLHPRLGAHRTPYTTRTAKKTYLVIQESDPENLQPRIDTKETLEIIPNGTESPGVLEQRNISQRTYKTPPQAAPLSSDITQPNPGAAERGRPQPSTRPPQVSAPNQGRTQLEELRSLIPPPPPVRHSGRSVIAEQSLSPVRRPSSSETPEYECVEGVTLDTHPVAAKEKATGLPLPVIEAQDIRNIPTPISEDVFGSADEEIESAVPTFNFVKRPVETDRHEPFSSLKRKIQQSSAYQALLSSSER